MRIALLIRTLLSGGAEKQCVILAEILSQKHTVVVIVQNGELINEDFQKRLDDANVLIIRLNKNNFISRSIELKRVLENKQVQLLFSYLTSDNLLAGAIHLLNRRIKVVGGIRNCKMDQKRFYINKILNKHVHSNTIFNNYSGLKEFTSRGFSPEKSCVISNCIDELVDEPFVREDKQLINVLSVCRFIQQKDLSTALAAIKLLIDKEKVNARFYLVGYGELEAEIRKNIQELGLYEIVEVVIKPYNLIDYYKSADIYLSTSLFEGTSNSIMEALTYRLPVVATNVGDNNQLVIHDSNGLLYPIGDIKGIANGLKLLCNSYSLRKRYGENSRSLIIKKFSKEQFEEKYSVLIDKIMSNQ